MVSCGVGAGCGRGQPSAEHTCLGTALHAEASSHLPRVTDLVDLILVGLAICMVRVPPGSLPVSLLFLAGLLASSPRDCTCTAALRLPALSACGLLTTSEDRLAGRPQACRRLRFTATAVLSAQASRQVEPWLPWRPWSGGWHCGPLRGGTSHREQPEATAPPTKWSSLSRLCSSRPSGK